MGKVEEIGLFTTFDQSVDVPPRVWMVTWNHDGTILASCGEDKCVRVWQHNKVAPLLDCRTTIDDSHTRAIRAVAFSHCGRFLASASFDASIVIYEKENGEFAESNKLEGHESEVKCCAFSPSDEFLATCSRDKSVWFWQLDEDDDFQVASILQPHTQDVKFVVWHPDVELLVSCSYDFSIKLYRYDGEDWVTQQKLDNAHEGTVWCADFNSAGDRLVTVGEDRVIQIFGRQNTTENVVLDTWMSLCRYKIEDSRWPLYTVSWNKTNDLIAVGGGDGTIRLLQLEDNAGSLSIVPQQTIDIHGGDVNCVAWCPSDSSLLASCSDDGSIRLTRIEL